MAAIFDLILIIFKLLGQVPTLYENYLKYKADSTYNTISDKLEAAFKEFVKAKAASDVQGQLNALSAIVKPKV